jgi:nucleotide-binding universal stress UspA family protein
MKKIIIAFDGENFSEAAFEFARKLQELKPILLTGVFLPLSAYSDIWNYTGANGAAYAPIVEENETAIIKKNIAKFEKHCQQNGINYRVHEDTGNFAIQELKKESIFADLLILGSETFFESLGTDAPNSYLQEALHDVKCPVLIVPEKFEFPKSIVLGYDGSEDAVYAIKQFAYLFPELCNRETLLVYANEDETTDFPDKILIEELAARHFSNLTLCKLDFNPKKFFSTWILEKQSVLLVSGSYSRSGLSQLVKKSFISEVMAQHELPIFIAHQ